MGGEMNPAPDRDEATTAWEPPTDSHVEPGYGDGDVDIPEMPSDGPTGPLTRRNLVFGALFITAALVGLYFLDSEAHRPESDLGTAGAWRSAVARGRRRLRVACRSPAIRCCSAPCSRAASRGSAGAPRSRSRSPESPPSGCWRRRERAASRHRVGAAPRRDGAPRDRLPDSRELLDSVFALPAGDRRGRARAVEWRLLGRRTRHARRCSRRS